MSRGYYMGLSITQCRRKLQDIIEECPTDQTDVEEKIRLATNVFIPWLETLLENEEYATINSMFEDFDPLKELEHARCRQNKGPLHRVVQYHRTRKKTDLPERFEWWVSSCVDEDLRARLFELPGNYYEFNLELLERHLPTLLKFGYRHMREELRPISLMTLLTEFDPNKEYEQARLSRGKRSKLTYLYKEYRAEPVTSLKQFLSEQICSPKTDADLLAYPETDEDVFAYVLKSNAPKIVEMFEAVAKVHERMTGLLPTLNYLMRCTDPRRRYTRIDQLPDAKANGPLARLYNKLYRSCDRSVDDTWEWIAGNLGKRNAAKARKAFRMIKQRQAKPKQETEQARKQKPDGRYTTPAVLKERKRRKRNHSAAGAGHRPAEAHILNTQDPEKRKALAERIFASRHNGTPARKIAEEGREKTSAAPAKKSPAQGYKKQPAHIPAPSKPQQTAGAAGDIPLTRKADPKELERLFGSTQTVDEFLERKIDDLDAFMKGTEGCDDVEAVARYVYSQKKGKVLIDDFTKILCRAGARGESELTTMMYNRGKAAFYLENMGFGKIKWQELARIYAMIGESGRRGIAREIGKAAANKDNLDFPDPPQGYNARPRPVYDMICKLGLRRLDILLSAVVELAKETVAVNGTYTREAACAILDKCDAHNGSPLRQKASDRPKEQTSQNPC
jgi:hypothetical protein